jgi:hypothetical protein
MQLLYLFVCLFIYSFIYIGACYVTQAGLKLTIPLVEGSPLSLPPKCWDYRHEIPHPASVAIFKIRIRRNWASNRKKLLKCSE